MGVFGVIKIYVQIPTLQLTMWIKDTLSYSSKINFPKMLKEKGIIIPTSQNCNKGIITCE